MRARGKAAGQAAQQQHEAPPARRTFWKDFRGSDIALVWQVKQRSGLARRHPAGTFVRSPRMYTQAIVKNR